jgi:hypothetical protein
MAALLNIPAMKADTFFVTTESSGLVRIARCDVDASYQYFAIAVHKHHSPLHQPLVVRSVKRALEPIAAKSISGQALSYVAKVHYEKAAEWFVQFCAIVPGDIVIESKYHFGWDHRLIYQGETLGRLSYECGEHSWLCQWARAGKGRSFEDLQGAIDFLSSRRTV